MNCKYPDCKSKPKTKQDLDRHLGFHKMPSTLKELADITNRMNDLVKRGEERVKALEEKKHP